MRIIIVIIFYGFSFQPGQASSKVDSEDTLYVWSKEGLYLKAAPADLSTNIALITGGHAVVLLERTKLKTKKNLLGTVNHKNFVDSNQLLVSGNRVLVEVNGQQGYMDDAFLLNIPTYDQTWYYNFLKAASGKSKYPLSGTVGNEITFNYDCADSACWTKLELEKWTLDNALTFWFYLTLHLQKLGIEILNENELKMGDGIEDTTIKVCDKKVVITSTFAT